MMSLGPMRLVLAGPMMMMPFGPMRLVLAGPMMMMSLGPMRLVLAGPMMMMPFGPMRLMLAGPMSLLGSTRLVGLTPTFAAHLGALDPVELIEGPKQIVAHVSNPALHRCTLGA